MSDEEEFKLGGRLCKGGIENGAGVLEIRKNYVLLLVAKLMRDRIMNYVHAMCGNYKLGRCVCVCSRKERPASNNKAGE